jgi:hypothetical protein
VIENRHIRSVLKSWATIEGAGVDLYRAIGFSGPEPYDPFLLLDGTVLKFEWLQSSSDRNDGVGSKKRGPLGGRLARARFRRLDSDHGFSR